LLSSDEEDDFMSTAAATKAKVAEKAEVADVEAEPEAKEEEIAAAEPAIEEEAEPEEDTTKADEEAAAKAEEERLAAEKAAAEAEAARLAEEERAEAERKLKEEAEKARAAAEAERKAAEEAKAKAEAEAKRKAEEEEALRKAEEEAAAEKAEQERAAAEKAEMDEEEKKKQEKEEQRQKEALEMKKEAERRQAAAAERARQAREDLAEDGETVPERRFRAKSTIADQTVNYGAEIAKKNEEEEAAQKAESRKAMKKHAYIPEETRMQKMQREEKEKFIAEKKRRESKVVDIKSESNDPEKRMTEMKKTMKKVKKKYWKPKAHSHLQVVNSSFTMKKGKKHKVKEEGHYVCFDRLPASCNIDEAEAEWTKNKKTDPLVPALVAFSTQARYTEFEGKVKKKNMKLAAGLVPLAQYATALCHLPEEYAIGDTIAEAIATLKGQYLCNDAVLPVDSYRGGDGTDDYTFVIVDRKQAFVFAAEDEETMNNWKAALKELQPQPSAEEEIEGADPDEETEVEATE